MASSIAAVVAGLAVGIALIAALSILDASPSFQAQYIKKDISTVVIPAGASSQDSGKNFEPPSITVVIGKNNTVMWVNKDNVIHSFKADSNTADPEFYNATKNNMNLLSPGQTFQFTFTKPGDFGYHGEPHPWLRGTVHVLVQR